MDITNPVFPLRCSARPLLQLHSLLVFWASLLSVSQIRWLTWPLKNIPFLCF